MSHEVVCPGARKQKQRPAAGPARGRKFELAHSVAFVAMRQPTNLSILNFETEPYPRPCHPRAESDGSGLCPKSAMLAAPRFAPRGLGGMQV
jgi:hypothetical protein